MFECNENSQFLADLVLRLFLKNHFLTYHCKFASMIQPALDFFLKAFLTIGMLWLMPPPYLSLVF